MPRKPPTADPPKGGFKKLAAALSRSRDTLVPPAHQVLFEKARVITLYGGRASAKSWSVARVLLTMAHEAPLRILCCREIQGSIRESAYRLLADQITNMGLDEHFDVQADQITHRTNGSRFFFEGLRYNDSKIRSYESIDICWIEEAQAVSDRSFETLLPTIRKRGSRIFITFNPLSPEDPVGKRFVEYPPPNTIAKKVSYLDNPFFSPESEAERAWLEQTDVDSYRHVWLGEPRTISDAQILRGKYFAESFEISPLWSGPYHGLDYGYAVDPSAAVRAYVDDSTRTLYVSHEFWGLKIETSDLPHALEGAIPGISRHVLYADSARPETTSGLQRAGFPHARSVEKWPGSIDDGLMFLRSFARIVIDPRCQHLLDECARYSFKTDRLTGQPLPEPLDKHNHLVDSLRYALSPLIRNQPTGGFFNRAALLEQGEPVEVFSRPWRIFAAIAATDSPGTAVGAVFFAHSPHVGSRLTVLGYSLTEMGGLGSKRWINSVYEQLTALRAEWKPVVNRVGVIVEEGALYDSVAAVADEAIFAEGFGTRDLSRIRGKDLVSRDSMMPLITLAERAEELRGQINAGNYVKLSRSGYTSQSTFRSSTTNHLTAQLLGYRPEAKDTPKELVAAFLLGCLVTRGDYNRPSAPTPEVQPVPPTPPRPPEPPTITLSVGNHVIDGQTISIPYAGLDVVQYPMSVGKHIVDGRIVWVARNVALPA